MHFEYGMYSYIIVIILELLTQCGGSRNRGLLVFKGEPDSSREFPFVVQLNIGTLKVIRCTGSLIEARWVLIAAHCVHSILAEHFPIKYGDYTRLPNETTLYRKVIRIIVHPNYGGYWIPEHSTLNDIALLFVERVPLKNYARLGAFDHKTSFGLPAKYAGFGHSGKEVSLEVNENVSLQFEVYPLQVGEGILVPCESYFGNIDAFFKYNAVCVMPKCSNKEQAARPGDSGGPLVHDGRVLGVASGVVNVGISYSAYTVVSPYIDWIQNTMRLNEN